MEERVESGRGRGGVFGDAKHAKKGHGGGSTKAESIMRAEGSLNETEEDVEHGQRNGKTAWAEAGIPLETTNPTEQIMNTAKPGRGKTRNSVAEVQGRQVDLNGPIGETMGDGSDVVFERDSGKRERSEAKLTIKPGITVPS